MSPVRLRSVARVSAWLAALSIVACSEPTPAPAPAPASPKAAEAPAPVDAKKPSPAPTPADAKKETTAPAPVPAGEDWLVWYAQGDQWATRWISAGASESTLVAERKALVLSDGTTLWRLERNDGDMGVLGCECLIDDPPPPTGCKPLARLTTPGLRAVSLLDGTVTPIHVAESGDRHGDGIDASLSIVGGVGSRLFYAWGSSGYMCGAHGTIDGSDVVFDLATGKPVDDAYAATGRALPATTREPAATEIQARLQECDGDDAPTLRQVLDEQMGLDGLHVALVGGTPTIRWHFTAETYYACSPDYAAHGEGTSGLVPEAAALGLGGPLPAGVAHALSQLGSVPTVGWSKLSLSPEARTAALEAFRRAPETAWPPAYATERPVDAGASDPAATKQARAKLDEGRKLTRAGDYPAAIATFDAAIALDAKLARAWSERGYAKLLAGDLAGAKADLEAALPLDEGAAFKAAVHYNLGQVAERGGDTAAAKSAYEASLALRDHETVRTALARLR